MTYTSLITFQVVSGRAADFEAAFECAGMLTRPRSVPGFQNAALHRNVENPDTYIVLGHWDSTEAYREWQRRSSDDVPGLADLIDTLTGLEPGQLFQPVAGLDPAPGGGD